MTPARLLTVLALLLAAPLALASGQDDEIVKEFRKYFKKYKDSATRVEAVLSLEGVESVKVVDALLPVLKLPEPEVVRSAVRILAAFETGPPAQAVVNELVDSKDERVRVGLLQAISAGRYAGGGEAIAELTTDKAWDVRRRAVQAIASLGGPSAVGAIAPLARDKEPAVRSATLEGLARLDSPIAVEAGIEALDDDVWQVRASAVAALSTVRRKESIPPLIARMEVEEGRLVADMGAALGEITGRNFGVRTELWQRFWDTYADRYVIPTDEELAALRLKQAERAEQYASTTGTSYHGIETPSRAILFVIDVSGSMENVVVEKERFEGGGYPSMLRIDIVKTELARTIEALEPYVEFNILAFATGVKTWKKGLVKANVLNKSSAMDWARRLEAIGGASKEDLARAGLVGSANLEAGKTNTHGALMAALMAPRPGKKDNDYEVAVDTIFFLSDGRPSHGDFVDPDDILREVRRVNDLRKIVLHTIAIGEFQKTFMKRLASENGGVYVDLGK
jgi:HEAT repeat protein